MDSRIIIQPVPPIQPLPPVQPVPPIGQICPAGSVSYPVGFGGEDFASLMVRYNVSYREMRAANPGISASPLEAGQFVCIPQAGSRPSCRNGSYTIQFGESLGTLPPVLNADIYAILRANPGLQPSQFTAGTTICRP